MKEKYIITIICSIFIYTFLFFVGCSSTKVLDVPLVSTTHSTAGPSGDLKLVFVTEVRGKYCDTIFFKDTGLMDNILKAIQKRYKIDYIKNMTVLMHGSDCMEIVGEGMRIQRQSSK